MQENIIIIYFYINYLTSCHSQTHETSIIEFCTSARRYINIYLSVSIVMKHYNYLYRINGREQKINSLALLKIKILVYV